MKKKLCALLVIIMLFTTLCPICSFASSEGYSNFISVKDIEKDLSLPDDVKNSWFYPYFKKSYDLGILNDRLSPTTMSNHDDTVSLSYATGVIAKVASIYLNDKYEFVESTTPYNGRLNKYTTKLGLIYGNEALYKVEESRPIYDSLYYNKTDAWTTKRDMQILLTRLFKIIEPGEEINSITRIVDVDNSATDKVNFEGVLQLYNLGIITGDNHGRFNYHKNITRAEFVTIIARVCFPELRVKISTEDYEKHFTNTEVITYNSLSNEYVNAFMQKYGWDKLYDNQNSNSYDIVYLNEIPKMIAAAGLNEVIDKTNNPQININEYWFNFFKAMGISDKDLTYSSVPIGKLEIAQMMIRLSNIFHKLSIGSSKSLSFDYALNHSNDDISVINNALNLGLLENTSEDIGSAYVTRSELNKMLVWFAMQSSSTCPTNKNKTGNARDNIVYDKAKWPSNASIYPYIVDNAPKEIYEITTKRMLQKTEGTRDPLFIYDTFKEVYHITDQNYSNFFSQLLNVDYTTIDTDTFIDSINPYCIYDLNYLIDTNTYLYRDSIEKYVEYVKQNKIKLKGTAKPILPIVYSDESLMFFVRTKLEFEIISSDTDKNLLLWDDSVTYNGNKFEVYVDFPGGHTYGSRALYALNETSPTFLIVKQVTGNIEVTN